MKHKYRKVNKADYAQLKSKMFFRLLGMVIIAFIVISVLYTFLWRNNGGDWIVSIFRRSLRIDYYGALSLYQQIFRNNRNIIWMAAIAIIFFVLLRFFLNWFTQYFNIINQGIDALLNEDESEIQLLPEMSAIEKKLNTVKQTLEKRKLEVQLAEQRKNDLVMYLAHDIKTPLTSVIGYLSLLEEAPDMPMEQKTKYLHITLDKAYRLEKMINEFFEITRYNLQQIKIEKGNVDLYYMLVQLTDELTPILSLNGNNAILKADENLTAYADPGILARVFNNILKNAVAYSYPNTEIIISAEEQNDKVVISFQNQGQTIPREELSAIFEKFYRMDEARTSNTGGAGLGLAIAKEIVSLHGGNIEAQSENNTIIFTVILPQPV
ncbi:two-component system sensor histidine kinase VanS [Kineothrix alysoides]|uniref:histidine kinase n=1 Tax=Kineothrix alysoides TaxID=1469948 RepID=A0A4R1QW11_9FIRM|nr:vancomycin resistance histidine kinase VanS [Kineothrix alysoides]TCL56855.1 two-component system sensor histidine kinase VanS [Kineothrix alysoides]